MEWDLSPLYASFDDPTLETDFCQLDMQIPALLAQLDQPAQADNARDIMLSFITQYTEILNRFNRVGSYIFLTISANATHAQALAQRDRLNHLSMNMERIRSAFMRFAGGIDAFDAILQSTPLLEQYRFVLEEARAASAHLLDPALEPSLLRMQLTGGRAWEQLRDMLDATLTAQVTQNGETRYLSLSEIRNMAYADDAATRKLGYETELASYKQTEIPLAAALAALKGEALTLCDARHYDSLLDQTLDASRMDHATLDAMLSAIRESLPDFRRYLKTKAQLLGHDHGLPFYDLFAPLGEGLPSFTVEEAHAYLVKVLGDFTPRMGAFVDNAFAQRWIDLFPHAGKVGGAFCSGNHALKRSWILTNFDGTFGAVRTLAHELGHAYHDACINDAKPLLLSSYPMPLAETASIFNETIVSQYALAHATPSQAFSLLEASLMESCQVIVDIYSRYLFETEVIETRKMHSMSVAELKDAMCRAQLASYGDGLDPQALHPYMWACKSHYYSADLHFYNFPYAFGLLFGMGVYAQYQRQGAAFVPIYEQLLAETGSDTIAGVAASVGIDVHNPDFWRSSLSVLRAQIDQFEKLALAR